MTTQVYYNGVILNDCETQSFEQTVEYDESSTDVLFSRFRVKVASTLIGYDNPEHPSTIAVAVDEMNVVVREVEIQARLQENRKDFWMVVRNSPASEVSSTLRDVTLLAATGTPEGTWDPSPPGGATSVKDRKPYVDCNNGPRPISVTVSQIFGGKAMRVVFEIEICRRRVATGFIDPTIVPSSVEPDNRVISNRWSLSESKDENWVTTKTMEGTLRVMHSSYWPHAMRYLCIPPLLSGYRRHSQKFVSDPTDLVLKYQIEDRQQHAAAPWPIISWSGTHSEATAGNGVTQTGSVHLKVTGPLYVDKRWLIGRAGQILVSRLEGVAKTNPETDYKTILKELAIIDHLHEPTIEMRANVRYTSEEYKWMAMRVNKMGLPLNQTLTIAGYSPKSHPVPLPYDSETPAGIFNCYLQHPVSVWHDMPGGIYPGQYDVNKQKKEKRSDTKEDAYEYPEGDPLPETTDLTKDDAELYTHPYSIYNMTNRYVTNHGYVQLPLAKPQAAPSDPTCAVVRMHAGICQRVIAIEAIRAGKWPTLPTLAPTLTDENGIVETLAKTEIDNSTPQMEADKASRSFAIQAVYTYILSRPPTVEEKLRAGSLPMDGTAPENNAVLLSSVLDADKHLQWEPPA